MPRRTLLNHKSASRRARKLRQRSSYRLHGIERLEDRIALSATPFGAQPSDTAEFLLGSVSVSVVLLESNKVQSDENPTVGTALEENWTPESIASVKQKVTEGLQWWVDTLAGITDKHQLSFTIDFTHADTPVSTRFEPITQKSTAYEDWIYDFLDLELETTSTFTTDIKAFNHAQREANDTNWAFTIFVVNDEHDADHRFASGGLDRAFAFPGGLFLVTLASRPASTITHETGHIFWALDEYQFGGTYDTTRGYYDTQNVNAWNNPNPDYVRQPSIMDRGSCEEGGGLLCDAYEQHTSSQSSLELLGWRDSDGDGVFDVLDVPHTLEGTGSYDPATGTYRFVGASSVQTLPNLNPRKSSLPTESLQNDITINRISRAEYRIDGGAWQTAAQPDSYVAALDLSFPVPATASQIEIRTIDATTGVSSPVFVGNLMRPSSMSPAGISGFVFSDTNGNGQIETGESGLAGRTVQLVDSAGQPIDLREGIEPDDYAPNANIVTAFPGVSLIAIGTATSGAAVYARSVGQGSTGSQAFSACSFTGGGGACSIFQTEWTSRTRQLRIDFAEPVTSISLDALSNDEGDYGRLAVYDADNNLLARYTTGALASGQVETMTVNRSTADIAYAIAGGHADSGVHLDNLRFGPRSSTVTDAVGAYSIPYLEAGSYRVRVEEVAGSQATTSVTQTVTLDGNPSTAAADFGFVAFVSRWQNQSNRFDVNNDGSVSPIDALQVINDLNVRGSRQLGAADNTPPFIDVDGDGIVAPIDVLLVVNAIDSSPLEGEASPPRHPTATGSPGPLFAEGEFGSVAASTHERLTNKSSLPSHSTLPVAPHRVGVSAASSSSAAPPSALAAETARLDDLLDVTSLDAALDEFAEDVAGIWHHDVIYRCRIG